MSTEKAEIQILRKNNAAFLQAVNEHCSNIAKLKVWFCNVMDFSPLQELTQLIDLEIADWPHDSFELFSKLKQLRRLSILHFPRVRDLTALESLRNIQELQLATLPGWDAGRKRMRFASFEPISGLSQLEAICLHGIVVDRLGLRPLGTLTRLRKISVDTYFPIEDYVFLAAKLPSIRGSLTPTWENANVRCEKCNAVIQFFRGRTEKKSPRYACPRCRPNLVSRHLALFASLQEKHTSLKENAL